MRYTEILDTIYDTIKLKVDLNGQATGTFRTDIDTYTVQISTPSDHRLRFGSTQIPTKLNTISFSSRLLGVGNTDGSNMEYTKYVYPTVVKTISMYLDKMKQFKKPVYGFTCSVAGDNARGSKRGIYDILFSMSPRFGFHKWGKELIAIPLDLYTRLKKFGFQTEDGTIVTDNTI